MAKNNTGNSGGAYGASYITELKFDSAQLLQTASELERLSNRINNDLEALGRTLDHTKSYWRGMAGDAYRTTYGSYKETIEEVGKALREYAPIIRTMASKLTEGGEITKAQTQALTQQVIP